MKIILVAGARPNFMKIAPLTWELKKHPNVDSFIVHTGQHYDERMSGGFFTELNMPEPKYNLGVGSGSHAQQTAKIMIAFEDVCLAEQPDMVLVVGDVNSTMACTIVAVKLGIKVAHLEAGLRSYDRRMPEEINRLLTDSVCHYHLTPSEDAVENLLREGIDESSIFNVGNIMIDTLFHFLEKAKQSNIANKLGLTSKNFVLVTLHRPSNVDDPDQLEKIVDLLKKIGEKCKVVFPVHPRTRGRLAQCNLKANEIPNILLTEALGYVDFLSLQSEAIAVITDSGGVQEETTVLSVPCITLRENTERPVTVTIGSNVLVGNDYVLAGRLATEAIEGRWKKSSIPDLWDGNTAQRVVNVLQNTDS